MKEKPDICRVFNNLTNKICMNQLTKETSQDALRNYFAGVITLSRSNNPFPVDLDDVWPLLYTSKGQAVRELKRKRKEGFDFIMKTGEVFTQKGENLSSSEEEVFDKNVKNLNIEGKDLGGRPTYKIFLSLHCLQEWVVRKVDGVFEVYLKVFNNSLRNTEGFALIKGPNTSYNLNELAGVHDVLEYIEDMHEKVQTGDNFPIFLPEVFNLVFPTMGMAVDELNNSLYGYKEGYDYIFKECGNQSGYYLSFNGFNALIASRSTRCKRAYERAVEQSIISEMPKLLEFKTTSTDVAATKKLIKTHNISGDMKEQAMEITDRIIVLMNLSEEPEAKQMLNNALDSMVKLNNLLSSLEENE